MNKMNGNLHSVAAPAAPSSQVRELTLSGVFVALLTVSAYLSFPLPFTPAKVTALTIMVNLVGFMMRPRQAAITMTVYLLLGAVGVPVFGAGAGGMDKLLGPTGGFYFGFWLAAVGISMLRGQSTNFKTCMLLGVCLGMPVIYVGGCISMYMVAKVGLWKTLIMAVFPFIFGDVLKTFAAAFIAKQLRKAGL